MIDLALYRVAKRQLGFAKTLKVIGDLDGACEWVRASRASWRNAKRSR